ncbi:MAG: DUF3861 domain-containing protein [Granulicella sp.]
MNSYRYRVTVEMLNGAKGEPVEGRALSFEVANHDDLLQIAARMRKRLPYAAETAASLAIGMKLFSEVALVHREDALFAKIRPAIGEFVSELKSLPDESNYSLPATSE